MPRMRHNYKLRLTGLKILSLPDERATTASGIEPGLGRQPPLLVNRRFLINIGLFKTRNRKINCHRASYSISRKPCFLNFRQYYNIAISLRLYSDKSPFKLRFYFFGKREGHQSKKCYTSLSTFQTCQQIHTKLGAF